MPYITPELRLRLMVCFTTKRNYTTLKLLDKAKGTRFVLLPKEITLLSNGLSGRRRSVKGFTTKRNYTTLKQANDQYLRDLSFTTKRNYTTLKRGETRLEYAARFTTKRNYTTLKPRRLRRTRPKRFTTKRNYTTLKQGKIFYYFVRCFTTKRNYTTLKPQIHGAKSTVLLPNRVISVDIYQQKLHKSESTINAFSHSRRS